MADSIITVTDKAQFEEIFNKYFIGNEVFVKTKNGNVKIKFLGYTEGQVAFLIPRVKNIPGEIVVFARFEGSTVYCNAKFVENHEDTFIFLPVKFQIIAEARKESRMALSTDGDKSGKNIMSITNIVTDFGIKTDLSNNERRLNPIREMISNELKKLFKHVNIFLISDGKNDNRMNYLLSENKNIFIPDLKGEAGEVDQIDYRSYINNIFSKDKLLASRTDLVSEITVILKYTGVIPYGYIQINCTKHLAPEVVSHVSKMSIALNELILKNKIISLITEKFLISDLSRNGLSIVFKDRKSTRYFRQRSAISFQLTLPDGININIGTIVRNINYLDNGIIKIGLEIKKIDPAKEQIYFDYIKSLGIS